MATDILRQVRMHEEKVHGLRMSPPFKWIYMGDELYSSLAVEVAAERYLARPGVFRGRATVDVMGYVFVREPYIEQPNLAVACDQEGNVLRILELEL